MKWLAGVFKGIAQRLRRRRRDRDDDDMRRYLDDFLRGR